MNPWPPPALRHGRALPEYPVPSEPGQLRPSGATAITAAVLSFLGAAANSSAAYYGIAVIARQLRSKYLYDTVMTFALSLTGVIVAFTLLAGALMLLRRRLAGRTLIAVACGTAMLVQISACASISDHEAMYPRLPFYVIGGVMNVFMAALTMTLVLVGSTRRWCLAKQPNGPRRRRCRPVL